MAFRLQHPEICWSLSPVAVSRACQETDVLNCSFKSNACDSKQQINSVQGEPNIYKYDKLISSCQKQLFIPDRGLILTRLLFLFQRKEKFGVYIR